MDGSSRRKCRKPKFATNIQINGMKDLIKVRLDFQFQPGYSQFSNELKQQFWKKRLQQLLVQQEKIVYWLPETVNQKDVQLAVELIEKYYTQNLQLNYQYEKTFVTSKNKQLLIYRDCDTVTKYLEKYKLPKQYEDLNKKVEKDALSLSETIITRNELVSLGEDLKVQQMLANVKSLVSKFENSFDSFGALMEKIFSHFKEQTKREEILLIAIRQSVIQKLREIAKKAGLFLRYRFAQTDGDEFKDIVIKKHKDYMEQNDWEMKSQSSRKSSVVQSSFQSQEQPQLSPPKGVDSVQLISLTEKTIQFRVNLLSQSKRNEAEVLMVTQKCTKSIQMIQINDLKQTTMNVSVNYAKNGYAEYLFQTKNKAGNSQSKQTYKIVLALQDDLTLIKKKSVYLLEGKDKKNQNGILPLQKIVKDKNGEFNRVTLPVTDISMSSKHAMICDVQGSVACWGAIYTCPNVQKAQEQQQIISYQPQSYQFSIQSPFLLMEKSNKIVKISCGFGYGLLLDIHGCVRSYGINSCGQLGLGLNTQQTLGIQEPEVIQTFKKYKSFIVDIHATENGSSFAIDSDGMMYRWGTNQVDQSLNPVIDRFGSIINYSTDSLILKQYFPIPIKKKFSDQKIIKIVNGNEFFLALNNNGDLYGWGQCSNLGIGKLLDKNEQEVENICNPLQIMKGVLNVSAGYDHAIVVFKDKKAKAWGSMKYLSNQIMSGKQLKPIDMTKQYGELDQSSLIECGKSYTVISRQGKIMIYGQNNPFEKQQYVWDKHIFKIICSQKYIGVLSAYESQSL